MKQKKTVQIFDVPTSMGCLENGTEYLGKHFRNHGFIDFLKNQNCKVVDRGSVKLPFMKKHNDHPIRNFPAPRTV